MNRGRGGNNGQGSNWIRKDKRRAIYARDEWRCVYCDVPGSLAPLTLDHIKPRNKGGSNAARNLVTCCHACNASKGDLSLRSWYRRIEEARGPALVYEVRRRVERNRRRKVQRPRKRRKRG